MQWQYTPYFIPLILSFSVASAVGIIAWQRRKAAGAIPLALLMVAVAVWQLAYALQLSGADFRTQFFWVRFRYLGIVWLSPLLLLFALQYTGRLRWSKQRRLLVWLALEPVVILVLVWTNARHGLFWPQATAHIHEGVLVWSRTHGIIFWLHFVYSYALIGAGIVLLVLEFWRTCRGYRWQLGLLLWGSLMPIVGNLISSFSWNPFPYLDLTPFGFTLSGLCMLWSLYGFGLLDVVPLARDMIVDGLQDGIVLLDQRRRILDLNIQAQVILECREAEVLGQPFATLLTLPELSLEEAVEIGLEGRIYEVRESPLWNRWRGEALGSIVSLTDITERKRTEAALQAQNALLENLVAVARVTAEHASLEATLQNVLDIAVSITTAEGGKLFILTEADIVQYCLVATGDCPVESDDGYVNQVLQQGLAGWAVQHRAPALASDTAADERWLPQPADVTPVSSALSIPILADETVLGVLTLEHSRSGHFTSEHLNFLQAAVSQMALALRNAQSYEAERQARRQQQILYEFIRTMSGERNPHHLLHAAVETIAHLTSWPIVAILLSDPTESYLETRATTSEMSVASGWRLPLEQGITGRAFRLGQSQYVPDVHQDADYVMDHPQVCSELAVPIRQGPRVLGVLNIESPTCAAFDAQDIYLAESLVEAFALVWESAQAHAKMGSYVADLSLLYAVTHAVGKSLLLDEVLSEMLKSALTALDFDAGLVSLVNQKTGALSVKAMAGLPAYELQITEPECLVQLLCERVQAERKPLVISDIDTEESLFDTFGEDALKITGALQNLEMRSCIITPLLHGEASLGTVCLLARHAFSPSGQAVALQMAVGRQVATAVTNARLFQAAVDERGRLQALIESSRDGILMVDADHRLSVVNARALDYLQLPGEPETWVGVTLAEVMQALPDAIKADARLIFELLGLNYLPREGEYTLDAHTIRWFDLPVMVGEQPLGRLLLLRDVTQERLVETLRNDLTHTMVHDLRNPLTGISGAMKLLSNSLYKQGLTSGQQQMFEIIQSSTQRMLELVNAILDISRLESGRMPMQETQVSVSQLVENVLALQTALAEQRDVRLVSIIASALPSVTADPRLIERVLQNLIGNALQFTPNGGEISVEVQEAAGALQVAVNDTGPGIPPEIQERLFQKFVSGRQEGAGSGLGLAFCRMVIENHGGRIWGENVPGAGARFAFTLPLSEAR